MVESGPDLDTFLVDQGKAAAVGDQAGESLKAAVDGSGREDVRVGVHDDRQALVDPELTFRLLVVEEPLRERGVGEGGFVVEALLGDEQLRVALAGKNGVSRFHVEYAAESLVCRELGEDRGAGQPLALPAAELQHGPFSIDLRCDASDVMTRQGRVPQDAEHGWERRLEVQPIKNLLEVSLLLSHRFLEGQLLFRV